MAQAVREQNDCVMPASITRRQLRPAEPPEGVQQMVWDVVVLATLSADARRRLRAGTRACQETAKGRN